MKKIDKVINYFRSLHEDVMSVSPTNSTNQTNQINIAGLPPDQPPVKKKRGKKYVYMQGLRKWWRQNT